MFHKCHHGKTAAAFAKYERDILGQTGIMVIKTNWEDSKTYETVSVRPSKSLWYWHFLNGPLKSMQTMESISGNTKSNPVAALPEEDILRVTGVCSMQTSR